ncbi:MAG: hypothetical protein V7K35_09535 [Nostoc sp.]|uniref:hypothetical protein n=1 Tax=Nostoc sp. TaxID=1180 RepID=UPI002FF51569
MMIEGKRFYNTSLVEFNTDLTRTAPSLQRKGSKISFLSPFKLRCTHKHFDTCNAIVSTDNAIVSTDNAIVSTDNAIVSTDNAIVLTDNAIVLTDNAIVSRDNAIVSIDNVIVSTDNAIVSADNANAHPTLPSNSKSSL